MKWGKTRSINAAVIKSEHSKEATYKIICKLFTWQEINITNLKNFEKFQYQTNKKKQLKWWNDQTKYFWKRRNLN